MGIVKGVDLGWLTQLEATKVSWVDAKGEKVDPLKYMKEMGVNGVRLRVFVNPPEEAYWNKKDNERCMLGFCDIESVVRMAKRVKSEGLSLMIDIHYSDHFADPEYQDIPEAWLNEDFEGLKEKVTQHTIEVMTKLGEQGIMPDWVQVGNEINNGILRPVGSFGDNPEQLVELLNAGYDAVKEISPNTKVITHLSGLPILDWLDGFLSTFTKLEGKTDIGYRDEKEVCRYKVETTGTATVIEAKCDRTSVKADGRSIVQVEIRLLDEANRVDLTACNSLNYKLEGDAKIIGIDNGCPECHELWKETRNRTAFNGLAYCVIRAGKTAGEVKLTVEGEGLTSAQLVFEQQ
ncbi:MAG: glycosyl hydrolase 53 family protein [Suilimivivens sp.]